MEDKKFTCCDCKKEFVWTTKEQQFFKDNKIDKEPVRCRECAIILRDKRKKEAEKEKDKQAPPLAATPDPKDTPAKKAAEQKTEQSAASSARKPATAPQKPASPAQNNTEALQKAKKAAPPPKKP